MNRASYNLPHSQYRAQNVAPVISTGYASFSLRKFAYLIKFLFLLLLKRYLHKMNTVHPKCKAYEYKKNKRLRVEVN